MDKVFKALADANRRKILGLLRGRELSVNELLSNFKISQATLSSHLAVLRKAGLVEVKVVGKQRIYKINKSLLSDLASAINEFVGEANKTVVNEEIIMRRKM